MPYLPLDPARDEIRVLSIVASDDSSKLVECSLKQVSLRDLTPLYSDYISRPAPKDRRSSPSRSAWKALERWVEFSQRHHDEPKANSCSILSIPSCRWEHGKLQFESWHSVTKLFEIQYSSKHAETPLFPRYNWGDFEALSYCWESEKLEKEIVLDGKATKVPKNLEAALRALRTLPETRTGMKFWVDYLCINQRDMNEKSHQMNFMSNVYSSALSVIAWLGPEEDESDKAIRLIIQIYWREGDRFFEKLPSPSAWESFHKFLSRNY